MQGEPDDIHVRRRVVAADIDVHRLMGVVDPNATITKRLSSEQTVRVSPHALVEFGERCRGKACEDNSR